MLSLYFTLTGSVKALLMVMYAGPKIETLVAYCLLLSQKEYEMMKHFPSNSFLLSQKEHEVKNFY